MYIFIYRSLTQMDVTSVSEASYVFGALLKTGAAIFGDGFDTHVLP